MTRDELLNFTERYEKIGERKGEERKRERKREGEERKISAAAQNAKKILLIPEFVMSRQIPRNIVRRRREEGAIKEVEKLFNLRGVNGKSSLTGDVKFAQKSRAITLNRQTVRFFYLRLLPPSPPPPSIFLSFFVLVEHVDESVHSGVSFAKLVRSLML